MSLLKDHFLIGQMSVLQSFAENTMNELLGWYGYDKVELRDSDNLEIGETPQHISVLKGMELKYNTLFSVSYFLVMVELAFIILNHFLSLQWIMF